MNIKQISDRANYQTILEGEFEAGEAEVRRKIARKIALNMLSSDMSDELIIEILGLIAGELDGLKRASTI